MLTATSNEHSVKLLRVKDRMHGEFKVAKKPLAGCDYMFEAHGKIVGLEVKWSLGDLLDSLKSIGGENSGPRLGVEVRRMLDWVDIPILITPPIRDRGDGIALRDDGQPTGWQYSSIKGILADVALYGVIIDEWDGDIAQRIAQWYFVSRNAEHGWIAQRGRPGFISLDPLLPQSIWSLCAFDGVGPETAQALLDTGWSVQDVANADVKMLQTVKGIGPKTAKNLYDGFRRKWG